MLPCNLTRLVAVAVTCIALKLNAGDRVFKLKRANQPCCSAGLLLHTADHTIQSV